MSIEESTNQTVFQSRYDHCIEILGSVLESVGTKWLDKQTGWYEFPIKKINPQSKKAIDFWSTSQALELLTFLLMEFKNNDIALSQDIERECKESIICGVHLLINNHQKRSSNPENAIKFSYRKNTDVLKFVWELRAISQIIKASNNVGLPENERDSLYKIGEGLLRDLFLFQDPNGGWSPFGDIGKSTYVTGMVIWAIAEANSVFFESQDFRSHKVHGTHIAMLWLQNNRVENLGIPFFEGGKHPSISRTGIASIAIWGRQQLKCLEPIPKFDLALNQTWIFEHQDEDGGWCDNIEEGDEPNVEVTSFALLALLKNGTKSTHPSIKKGINWLISCFRQDDTVSGWGNFCCSVIKEDIKIWTTWSAVLALMEYVKSSKKWEKNKEISIEIASKPNIVFLREEQKKKIEIQLNVQCPEDTWAYFHVDKNNSFKVLAPKVILLKKPITTFLVELYQMKSGYTMDTMNIQDTIEGNTLPIEIKIISPPKLFNPFIDALTDPKVVFASITASFALFTILSVANQLTLNGIIDAIIRISIIFVMIVCICALCSSVKHYCTSE